MYVRRSSRFETNNTYVSLCQMYGFVLSFVRRARQDAAQDLHPRHDTLGATFDSYTALFALNQHYIHHCTLPRALPPLGPSHK